MTDKSEPAPFFSVVIPVFNRVDELSRALGSVLAQDEPDFELLIVDDGSAPDYADRIQQLVSKAGDPRVQLLRYTENRNGAHARNVGIRRARGQYICLLDSDDEWLPGKLRHVRKALGDAHPRILYHQYKNVFGQHFSAAFPPHGIKPGQSVAEYSFCDNRIGGIQSSCVVVERELAQQVGFNEQLRGHQDWDFVLRLGEQCQDILFVARVLTLRHLSDNEQGSVSQGLSYDFSLQFLRDYSQLFSLKAQAAYAAHVLTARRLLRHPVAPLTRFDLLAWLFYPGVMLPAWRRHRALVRRCRQLLRYCKRNKIRGVCLVGYNDYARYLLSYYGDRIPVKLVVDRQKRGMDGHTVLPASEVSAEQWQQIDLAVTMTDRHHDSMTADLEGLGDFTIRAF